mgnify:CR=1 FL=1|jgi:transcriptional regulator with XRE-family HTH domain
MNKKVKTDYILKGMEVELNKKPSSKLFNQIIGLKFKSIRLNNNLTAEAVVEDNKIYFNSIYELYKFEKGIKQDGSKLFRLSKYFNFDLPNYLDNITQNMKRN